MQTFLYHLIKEYRTFKNLSTGSKFGRTDDKMISEVQFLVTPNSGVTISTIRLLKLRCHLTLKQHYTISHRYF